MSENKLAKAEDALSSMSEKLDKERRDERRERMRCAALDLAIQVWKYVDDVDVLATASSYAEFIIGGDA